tara:strand:- start:272 stop:520 length:249 start_codon:yes stop_codon:yes gene_type:complete
VKTFYDSKKDAGQDAGGGTPPSPPTKKYPDDWYYTENQWSRLGMLGPLPEERRRPTEFLAEYGEEIGSTDREILQEKVDTKI